MQVTGTGRLSGIPIENPSGNVYDFAGGRIQSIRIFFDRGQALEAAGLREQGPTFSRKVIAPSVAPLAHLLPGTARP